MKFATGQKHFKIQHLGIYDHATLTLTILFHYSTGLDFNNGLLGWVEMSRDTRPVIIGNATRRNGSTSVDLVEDCKKATSIHFFVSQQSQVKTKETEWL